MNNNSNFLTKILSEKIFLVLGSILFAFAGVMFLSDKVDIEPMLIFTVLASGFIIGIQIYKQSFDSSLIPYLFLQFVFAAMSLDQRLFSPLGIKLRPHALIMLFGILCTIYYLKQDFGYYWKKFLSFRLMLLFFIVDLVYFFFYYSSFNLGSAKIGYLINFDRSIGNEDAKLIVFLGGLGSFIALTIALTLFKYLKTRESINAYFVKIAHYIVYIFVGYYAMLFLLVASGLSKIQFGAGRLNGEPLFGFDGINLIFAMFLIFFAGLKSYLEYQHVEYNKKFMDIALIFLVAMNLIFILLFINKTSIIALTGSLLTFLIVSYKIKVNVVKSFFGKKTGLVIIAALGILGAVLFGAVMQNSEFIVDTANNIVGRFSSFGTLNVRQSNWQFFIDDWISNLSIFKTIFGFGVGASREAIFFISAMRPGTYLVQTTHNNYMEMFYDYGLMALLYYGAIIAILVNDIKILRDKYAETSMKILSNISLCIILFYFIYHTMDGARVATVIVFFSMLGLLESMKYSCIKGQCG